MFAFLINAHTHTLIEQRQHSAVHLLFLSLCNRELKVDLGRGAQKGQSVQTSWRETKGRRGRVEGNSEWWRARHWDTASGWTVQTSYVWSMSKRIKSKSQKHVLRAYIILKHNFYQNDKKLKNKHNNGITRLNTWGTIASNIYEFLAWMHYVYGPAERNPTAASSSLLVEQDQQRPTWEQISIIHLSTRIDRWPFLSI